MPILDSSTVEWTPTDLDRFLLGLDARIAETVKEIEASDVYKAVFSPRTDDQLLRDIMRELYLEVYSYQPQVIEAAIAIIAKMPRSDAKMVTKMLVHQGEEFDHGEMALRDYVALGGDEEYARTVRASPASFAVRSVWWGIWRTEDPFTYLGALYPFEGLTPIVCGRAEQALQRRGFPVTAMEFLRFHAAEDLRHTKMVRDLIEHAVKKYEGAAESIHAGLDYFLQVYPLPVWMTAYKRATRDQKLVS
jgi:pyrroloquinoline quinone (PQQ) biosynthesis protein C